MSESSTASQILSSLKKKVRKETEPVETKSFTKLFDKDVKPELMTLYKPRFVDLPALQFTLDVEFQARQKDFEYLMQMNIAALVFEKAQASVVEVLKPIAKELRVCDRLVGADFQKEDEAVKQIKESVAEAQTAASAQMSTLLEAAIKAHVQDKKRLKSFRIKSAAKIFSGTLAIVGSVAHAALSWGATAPLAVVNATRAGFKITQAIVMLCISARKLEVVISGEFKLLETMITKVSSDQKLSDKLKNDAKEIGLSALSALTGIEGPSVDNIAKRIERYRSCVTELENEASGLAKAADQAMQANTDLSQAVIVKSNNKLAAVFDLNAKGLSDVLDKIAKINVEIKSCYIIAEEFEKRHKKLAKAKHGWTEWVAIGLSVGVDLGLGVGSVSAGGGAETLQTEAQEAAERMNQIIERTMEAVTAVGLGAFDTAVEKAS